MKATNAIRFGLNLTRTTKTFKLLELGDIFDMYFEELLGFVPGHIGHFVDGEGLVTYEFSKIQEMLDGSTEAFLEAYEATKVLKAAGFENWENYCENAAQALFNILGGNLTVDDYRICCTDDKYVDVPLPCHIAAVQLAQEADMQFADKETEIAIIWGIDDVLGVREDLTEEQAVSVLKTLQTRHDATIGINWDVIEITANELFPVENLWLEAFVDHINDQGKVLVGCYDGIMLSMSPEALYEILDTEEMTLSYFIDTYTWDTTKGWPRKYGRLEGVELITPKDEDQAQCNWCNKSSTISEWNRVTEANYGEAVETMATAKVRNAEEEEFYVCPHCGKYCNPEYDVEFGRLPSEEIGDGN